MSAITRREPANLVQPGWSVRANDQWHEVIVVAETERPVAEGGPRVWIFVRGRNAPLIFEWIEEVETRREDSSP